VTRVSAARAIALAVLLPAAAAAAVPVPRLTGPVVDLAGVLDASGVRRLDALAREARARDGGNGVQLQYLLVPSLQGEPIAEFSIRVAEAWKIGSRGRDNGLLVVVALQDRAFRIEVGGGLEGEITDAQARRIGDQILRPAFRAGRFADGLYDAGAQLLALAGAMPAVWPQEEPRGRPIDVGGGVALAIFAVVWIVLAISRGFGPRRRRHLWWGGGPWIGGGWGGGGGGSGGGWSGGGGGFSGGGSSGSW